ncbi:unnamed protein product [Acanthosepion pharaonis]|uniref:Uncharacterized protein n=1 Tax=Acanthosepion pharaonis TaxID=158019 RepID=A0A812CET6_ACAPH|nr:unnamed protein product [Sepia pharaonis]
MKAVYLRNVGNHISIYIYLFKSLSISLLSLEIPALLSSARASEIPGLRRARLNNNGQIARTDAQCFVHGQLYDAAVSPLTDLSHQFFIPKQPSFMSLFNPFFSSPSNRCFFSLSSLSPDTITSTGSVASTNNLHFLESFDLVFCLVSVTPCFKKAILRRSVESILALLKAAATTFRTKLCL